MANTQCLIATILLLSLMHAGSTLKCYECSEDKGRNGICRNPRGVENAIVHCSRSCVTHTVDSGIITTGELVFRVCADPSYCEIGGSSVEKHTDFKTKSCTVCNTDHCN